jgi:hypothetical protein
MFSYYKEELRNLTLDLLFKAVGYLSGHNFVHVQEDTAELVHDRRGLKISFVFGGQSHKIVLPYNPYRIDHREYVVYSEDDSLPIANIRSTLPGLEECLFNKENLEKIYSKPISRVQSVMDDD